MGVADPIADIRRFADEWPLAPVHTLVINEAMTNRILEMTGLPSLEALEEAIDMKIISPDPLPFEQRKFTLQQRVEDWCFDRAIDVLGVFEVGLGVVRRFLK